jgi:hypothetical protein
MKVNSDSLSVIVLAESFQSPLPLKPGQAVRISFTVKRPNS